MYSRKLLFDLTLWGSPELKPYRTDNTSAESSTVLVIGPSAINGVLENALGLSIYCVNPNDGLNPKTPHHA